MTNMIYRRIVIILFSILLFSSIANGQENPGKRFPLGFNFEAQSQMSLWFTSDDDDNEEYTGHAIDYETDGAKTWMVAGAIKWHGQNLFGGRVIRPYSDTPEQRAILEKTTTAVTTLEDYLIYLDLLGFGYGSDNSLLRFLSGLRLDYRRNYYHGRGTAVEYSIFASRSGEMTPLDIEDTFQFQADFRDWYLSFLKLQVRPGRFFRFGGYKSVLKKPHESILEITTPDGRSRNLIVETKLSGYGGFGRIDMDSFYFLLRIGAVKFEPQGDIEEYMFYKSQGSFAMLMDLRWGPQIRLARSLNNKIYLVPMFGLLFRADSLNSDTSGLAIIDSELSMDIILDFSLRFRWNFN